MKPRKLKKKMALKKETIANLDKIVSGKNFTGNCASIDFLTCGQNCDLPSIPFDECHPISVLFITVCCVYSMLADGCKRRENCV